MKNIPDALRAQYEALEREFKALTDQLTDPKIKANLSQLGDKLSQLQEKATAAGKDVAAAAKPHAEQLQKQFDELTARIQGAFKKPNP